MSIIYKMQTMQLDIVQSDELCYFEFKFYFKDNNSKSNAMTHPFDKSQAYDPNQITGELIEKEVVENFNKMEKIK